MTFALSLSERVELGVDYVRVPQFWKGVPKDRLVCMKVGIILFCTVRAE